MARFHAITGSQWRRTVRIAGISAYLVRRLKALFAPGIIGCRASARAGMARPIKTLGVELEVSRKRRRIRG